MSLLPEHGWRLISRHRWWWTGGRGEHGGVRCVVAVTVCCLACGHAPIQPQARAAAEVPLIRAITLGLRMSNGGNDLTLKSDVESANDSAASKSRLLFLRHIWRLCLDRGGVLHWSLDNTLLKDFTTAVQRRQTEALPDLSTL